MHAQTLTPDRPVAFVRSGRPCGPRPGFTLIEMLVSLAVVLVALAVVGVVFNVTTKTAGEAAAYAEVQSWLRQFTFELKNDLRHCDPSQSMLILVGRTQAAGRTEADRVARRFYRLPIGGRLPSASAAADFEFRPAAGWRELRDLGLSDPRADLLMFFSQRPTRSQAPPRDPPTGDQYLRAVANGARLTPVQIVYGHASFDEAAYSAASYIFGSDGPGQLVHIQEPSGNLREISPIPATRWVLARRAALVRQCGGVGEPPCPSGDPLSFSDTEMRYATRCYSYDDALAGDVVRMDLRGLLRRFSPSLSSSPLELDYSAYESSYWGSSGSGLANGWDNLVYPLVARDRHMATIIANPPPELKSNMSLQALPGCVWFQVEFLAPEDPRHHPDYVEPLPAVGTDFPTRHDLPLWSEVPPDGSVYLFAPDSPELRGELSEERLRRDFRSIDPAAPPIGPTTPPLSDLLPQIRPRLWPYAIRITVKAIDAQGRLKEPVTRSVIHRFE